MNKRKRRYEQPDFHIYVKREVIGTGVQEERHLSGGWICTSSHLFFQEALDEKDRDNAKGLDVLLVDTIFCPDTFPRRTFYGADGSRREHPKRSDRRRLFADRLDGVALLGSSV